MWRASLSIEGERFVGYIAAEPTTDEVVVVRALTAC